MFKSIDQLGREIDFTNLPKRIISLVPSQTELLHYLGLENEVVGITKFCIHPNEWFNNKPRIGGTKNVNIEAIKALNPDLIFANKEENVKEQIEELAKYYPVWISDVNNFGDALQMILSIGDLVGKVYKAENLIAQLRAIYTDLLPNHLLQSTVCYLIWRNPYMTVGGNTYINNMLQYVGVKNVFENTARYPEITMEQIEATNCNFVLLSSEPYPFKQVHIDEIKAIMPNTKVLLVDGEMFSWYGSRLKYAPEYFSRLQEKLK